MCVKLSWKKKVPEARNREAQETSSPEEEGKLQCPGERETKACITTCFTDLQKQWAVSSSPAMAESKSANRGQRLKQLSNASCAAPLHKTIIT